MCEESVASGTFTVLDSFDEAVPPASSTLTPKLSWLGRIASSFMAVLAASRTARQSPENSREVTTSASFFEVPATFVVLQPLRTTRTSIAAIRRIAYLQTKNDPAVRRGPAW